MQRSIAIDFGQRAKHDGKPPIFFDDPSDPAVDFFWTFLAATALFGNNFLDFSFRARFAHGVWPVIQMAS